MNTFWRFAAAVLMAASTAAVSAAQTPASGGTAPIADEASLARALVAARSDAERAALAEAHPALVTQTLVRAIVGEGNQRMSARDPIPADAAYATAFWVADRLDWPEGRARALTGRGTIAGQTGRYDEAIAFLTRAAATSDGRNDQDHAAALNNLGIVYRLLGDYDQALASYERTLMLATRTGREDTVARALHNIGLVTFFKGRYREALGYYERSLALKETLKVPDVHQTLNNIGAIHETLGNPALALDYYTRATAAAEQTGNRAAAAAALSNIGHVKAAQRLNEDALSFYRRALAIHEATGNRADQAIALENIGTLMRGEGRVADAIDHLERSLAIREALGGRPGIADALIELAATHVSNGDADRAAWLVGRATALAEEMGLRSAYFRAQTIAGDAALARGRLDEAERAYTEATGAVEALRLEVVGAAPERARFFENKLDPYYGLAAVHLRAGRLNEAFAASERARARGLLDVLDGGDRPAVALSAEERERERAVERAIVTANAQIAAETARARPDAGRLAALRAMLTRARLDREDLLARFYATHPDLQFARGETAQVASAEIARLLGTSAALVEFLVTPAGSWALVLTGGLEGPSITAHKLQTTRADLEREASAFRGQLASRDLSFTVSAKRLYQLLIAPVERRLKGRRLLVIVPDGPLWQLPFPALVAPVGRYLIEDRAVAYAPSASTLGRLHDRRAAATPASLPFLAIGDPAPGAAVPAALRADGGLKEASRELEALAGLYGTRDARLFTGAAATESRFRAEAARAAIVHVATHGILDDGNAMYSYIALAGGGGEEESDGRLEAREIRELRMPADVAVLSACETALGRVRGGEGVIGLSWALFAAGASSAVVSQWKVDSAATADLMIALHTHMRDAFRKNARTAPAESLRRAAMSVMRDPRYRHPFYWAGFLVIGDL